MTFTILERKIPKGKRYIVKQKVFRLLIQISTDQSLNNISVRGELSLPQDKAVESFYKIKICRFTP